MGQKTPDPSLFGHRPERHALVQPSTAENTRCDRRYGPLMRPWPSGASARSAARINTPKQQIRRMCVRLHAASHRLSDVPHHPALGRSHAGSRTVDRVQVPRITDLHLYACRPGCDSRVPDPAAMGVFAAPAVRLACRLPIAKMKGYLSVKPAAFLPRKTRRDHPPAAAQRKASMEGCANHRPV